MVLTIEAAACVSKGWKRASGRGGAKGELEINQTEARQEGKVGGSYIVEYERPNTEGVSDNHAARTSLIYVLLG